MDLLSKIADLKTLVKVGWHCCIRHNVIRHARVNLGRDFRRRIGECAVAALGQQSAAPVLGSTVCIFAAVDDAGRVVLGGIVVSARPNSEARNRRYILGRN